MISILNFKNIVILIPKDPETSEWRCCIRVDVQMKLSFLKSTNIKLLDIEINRSMHYLYLHHKMNITSRPRLSHVQSGATISKVYKPVKMCAYFGYDRCSVNSEFLTRC